MKKVLEVLALPVGTIIAIIGATTLVDGMGGARTGSLFTSLLVFLGGVCLVHPSLRKYGVNTMIASTAFTSALVFGFVTLSMSPLSGFESAHAWGEWGPYLGYISDQPKSQMIAECIITGMVTIVLSLAVWTGYGFWQDHTRLRQMVAQ